MMSPARSCAASAAPSLPADDPTPRRHWRPSRPLSALSWRRRIHEELAPVLRENLLSRPDAKTYFDEVFLPTTDFTLDTVFGAALDWSRRGADRERLKEALSGILMKLVGRSLVATADIMITGAQRQMPGILNGPGRQCWRTQRDRPPALARGQPAGTGERDRRTHGRRAAHQRRSAGAAHRHPAPEDPHADVPGHRSGAGRCRRRLHAPARRQRLHPQRRGDDGARHRAGLDRRRALPAVRHQAGRADRHQDLEELAAIIDAARARSSNGTTRRERRWTNCSGESGDWRRRSNGWRPRSRATSTGPSTTF